MNLVDDHGDIIYENLLINLKDKQAFHLNELEKIKAAIKGLEPFVSGYTPKLSSRRPNGRIAYDVAVEVLSEQESREGLSMRDLINGMNRKGKNIKMTGSPIIYEAAKRKDSDLYRHGDGINARWRLKSWG